MLKRLLVLALVTSLTACVTPGPVDTRQVDLEAELETTQSAPKKALKQYQSQLAEADETERARLNVLIAEALLELEETEQLGQQLSTIDTSLLGTEDQVRLMCVRAGYLLALDRPLEAVKNLPKNQDNYPRAMQLKILDTQARALSAAGYRVESVRSRLQLQRLLQQADSLDANARRILQNLSSLPEQTLEQLQDRDIHPDLDSWIDFVQSTKTQLFSVPGFDTAVLEWQSRNPDHTVPQSLIMALRTAIQDKQSHPEKIALMLPLSGRYAAQAQSIRDGFIAAYYDDKQQDKSELIFLDTQGDASSAPALLQEAKQSGAGLVVGPLTKQAITALNQLPRLPLPVLALNYIDEEADNAKPNLYQFGLLPEDEAVQAARMALLRNLGHAVVMAPKNTLGQRMAEAFKAEFEKFGGRVLDVQLFDSSAKDFGRPIKNMLNIQQSQSRKSILQTILRRQVHFEPYVRKDVDVIYMVSSPIQARGIKPQLKFHEAGHIPVLANSQIFNGVSNPAIDRDIDGVSFTQTPWRLKVDETPLHQQLLSLWQADVVRYGDLYALGADAYNLIPYLNRLAVDTQFHIDGYTGSLSADSQHRIHRELLWAKFEEGKVKLEDNLLLEFKDATSLEQEATATPPDSHQ